MLVEESDILLIRLPGNIEDITHNGDDAYQSIKANIRHHPEQDTARHTQSDSLIDNIGRQERAKCIPYARDKAKQTIKTHPLLRTWNPKLLIKHVAEKANALEARFMPGRPWLCCIM